MRANTPEHVSPSRLLMLLALDRAPDYRFSAPERHIYGGTVPAATVAKRRAKNRAARVARRTTRRNVR